MMITSTHLNTCMETWLQCEALLLSISERKKSFSTRTIRILEECADICFGALQTLKMPGKSISQMALLCVGICEECAELCERYADKAFIACALTCRQCSSMLSPIAASAIR